MSENNKIVVCIAVVCSLVIISITVFMIKNRDYTVDDTITIEKLSKINENMQNGNMPTLEDFEKYEPESTEKEDGITVYKYDMDCKYELKVMAVGQKIGSIYLINKVTGDYVDIVNGSLERFLAYN